MLGAAARRGWCGGLFWGWLPGWVGLFGAYAPLGSALRPPPAPRPPAGGWRTQGEGRQHICKPHTSFQERYIEQKFYQLLYHRIGLFVKFEVKFTGVFAAEEDVSHCINIRDAGGGMGHSALDALHGAIAGEELDGIDLAERVGTDVLGEAESFGGAFDVVPDGLAGFMLVGVSAWEGPNRASLGADFGQKGLRKSASVFLAGFHFGDPHRGFEVGGTEVEDVGDTEAGM